MVVDKNKMAKMLGNTEYKELEEIVDECIDETYEQLSDEEWEEIKKEEEEVTPHNEVLTAIVNLNQAVNNVSSGQNKIHKYLIHSIDGEDGVKARQKKTNFLLGHAKKIMATIFIITAISFYSLAVTSHETLVKPYVLDKVADLLIKKAVGATQ